MYKIKTIKVIKKTFNKLFTYLGFIEAIIKTNKNML